MKNSDYRILLVDDEPDIVEFMSYNLKKEGYEIFTATSGEKALKLADKVQPHLIILDVMMPDQDGIETCEELRKNPKNDKTVIAFLTARGEDYSQVAGFEAGADDYIAKPIKPKVLLSRIGALLKRYGISHQKDDGQETVIREGDLLIDKERFIVTMGDKELVLPKKEFELLNLLISKPGKVFTRDEIFSRIWGENVFVGDRTIDVHIRKLREKIGNKYIKTIKGVGYKYVN